MNYNQINFIGRHCLIEGREYFSYSGCGFEFTVENEKDASVITIILDSVLREYNYQFIGIYINDLHLKDEKLTNGKNIIEISLKDSPDINKIKIIKLNETYFSAIYLNGILLLDAHFKNAKRDCKKVIGYFGDSVTCGFGNLDYHGEEFKMETEDFRKTYAYLAAEALGMTYSVVARGGMSVAFPIYNEKLIGDIYDTVDMYHECNRDENLDYAVINLGANDNSGYLQLTNDKDRKKSLVMFKQKYLELIERIIENNSNVKFILCFHMLPLEDSIINAIKEIYNTAKIMYKNQFELLECKPNTDGACCHPYWTAHEEASILLIKILEKYEKMCNSK